jgi:6-phosphogluconolactonase (cycloisomerase 2 family)
MREILHRSAWRLVAVLLISASPAVGSDVLFPVEIERDGAFGATALDGAAGPAASPDGQHVYVASAVENAIAVFARDAATGKLAPVQDVRDGVGGVAGLLAPISVVVTPDGAHVYAAALTGDAIVIFSRDAPTGSLTYVATVADGGVLPPLLDGVQTLAISEDGLVLYAVSRPEAAISVFARDAVTGVLTLTQTVQEGGPGIVDLSGPVGIALHPDGYDAYVTSLDDGAILHFQIGVDGTLLVPVGTPLVVNSGFEIPQLVACSPDGRFVYMTDSGRDEVSVFEYDFTDGSLDLIQLARDGEADFDGLDGAAGLAVHPQGTLVYVTGVAEDAVTVLARDITTGLLSPLDVRRDGEGVDGLDNPALLAPSPDGRHLYVASLADDAVVGFELPNLRFADAAFDGAGGVEGLLGARAAVVSPDSRFVYVVSPEFDSVAFFALDAATGALAFGEATRDGTVGVDGLAGAFDLAMSPDGRHLYVRGADDSALAVFVRDTDDGTLAFAQALFDGAGGIDGLAGEGSVAVSPDGAHVYATSGDDSAVSIFARNPSTGLLSFAGAIADGDPGVTDLDGAFAIALSPGGEQVYVSGFSGGFFGGALTVFARNAATGALTPAQVLREGSGGIEDALGGPVGIRASPDGRHVYVSAVASGAIGIFDRDSGDGTLLLVGRGLLGSASGIVSSSALGDIALSPDGTRLFASSRSSLLGLGPQGFVTVFVRDPISGRLDDVIRHADDRDGFTGMDGLGPLAVTPDGRHLLLPASRDDALVVLAVPEPRAWLGAFTAAALLAHRRLRTP